MSVIRDIVAGLFIAVLGLRMAAGPPPFVLEASELLRLPPEVLRLAKRSEALGPEARALLRARLQELSGDEAPPRLAPRDMLLAMTSSLVARGGWGEGALLRYLDRVQRLSPCFAIGLPATLAPAALHHLRSRRQTSQAVSTKTQTCGDLDRLDAIAAKHHSVLLKLRRLRQLESSRVRLLQRISQDEFLRRCGVSQTEQALFLLAAMPGEQSSSSLRSTCLELMQAQSALSESLDNEIKFLLWLKPDADTRLSANIASDSPDAVGSALLQALPCLIELQDAVHRILSKQRPAALFSSSADKFFDRLVELINAHGLPSVPLPLDQDRRISTVLLQQLLFSQMRYDGALEDALKEQHERLSRILAELAKDISDVCPFNLGHR